MRKLSCAVLLIGIANSADLPLFTGDNYSELSTYAARIKASSLTIDQLQEVSKNPKSLTAQLVETHNVDLLEFQSGAMSYKIEDAAGQLSSFLTLSYDDFSPYGSLVVLSNWAKQHPEEAGKAISCIVRNESTKKGYMKSYFTSNDTKSTFLKAVSGAAYFKVDGTDLVLFNFDVFPTEFSLQGIFSYDLGEFVRSRQKPLEGILEIDYRSRVESIFDEFGRVAFNHMGQQQFFIEDGAMSGQTKELLTTNAIYETCLVQDDGKGWRYVQK